VRRGRGGGYVSVRPLILLSPRSRDDTQIKCDVKWKLVGKYLLEGGIQFFTDNHRLFPYAQNSFYCKTTVPMSEGRFDTSHLKINVLQVSFPLICCCYKLRLLTGASVTISLNV
jgi:hypothetical protein